MLKQFVPKRLADQNVDLMRAQVEAFAKQIPLLYFVLLVNCVTVSVTSYGHAPDLLTVAFPAVLAVLSIVRIVIWSTAKPKKMTDEAMSSLLGRLYTLGLGLGAVVIGWALALFILGTPEMRSHVTVVVGLTVFAGMFCLMHVRQVALLMAAIIMIPFSLYLVSTMELGNISIAINILLVTAAMIVMLHIVSRDFERMVKNRAETRRLSDENARLAAMDSLTDLPNRRQFFSRLERLLKKQEGRLGKLAVGVIDLDGFKPVNDLYGHVVGDGVLMQVAERLRQVSGDRAFVARLGGDEFALILEDCGEPADILNFGMEICGELEIPYTMPNAVANLSGSIGFSILQETGTAAMTLYERADFALYHAKQNRRGRPVIFSEQHETALRKHGVIDQALRAADLDAETEIVFQPLYDTNHNRVTGFEALARWTSPTLGPVPPSDFIPVAERSEIICKLTHVLLRKALRVAHEWPNEIGISFNLSVRDLISSASILQIISIVNASGVDPKRIDFEVTETALLLDFDLAQDSIRALKALGCGISLDDFGTGYSSLSYVHRLPLDKIKIDRSFVTDIETKDACRNIVKTVVGLCRDLGIDCVVEGMETETQADILRDLGCRSMQGYYFGKPLQLDGVRLLMSKCEKDERKSLVA